YPTSCPTSYPTSCRLGNARSSHILKLALPMKRVHADYLAQHTVTWDHNGVMLTPRIAKPFTRGVPNTNIAKTRPNSCRNASVRADAPRLSRVSSTVGSGCTADDAGAAGRGRFSGCLS